ncbi:hypothetical protein VTO42DRAFT_966 [Malbranchea cinnamomea]
MASRNHSPTPSTESATYQWVLEHVLKYPGSYELPLRTMYELNSMPRPRQPLASQSSHLRSAFSNEATGNVSAPLSTKRNAHQNNAVNNVFDNAALFKANLMSQIAQRPHHPGSLPPSFVTSFVLRGFPADIDRVEFAQALTALDYLKDLETTRRTKYSAALAKLGVSEHDEHDDDLVRRYPGVAEWVVSIKRKNRLALALYTQVYLRLRHWTLINEILLAPFNKANCIAMLNTLFPPIITKPPTPYLNDQTLRDHRAMFLGLIRDYEKKGKQVLNNFMMKDVRPGDTTGWPVVHEHIENYLRIANEIIDECFEVNPGQALEEKTHGRTYNGRKVDSGVSFTLSDRPPTSGSSSSGRSGAKNKPLPSPPLEKQPRGAGSTLERIAKEIRKMKSRPNLGENVKEIPKARPSALKRVKSAGLLRLGKDKKQTTGDSDEAAFDVDHFRRKRQEWEAEQAKRSSA